LRVCADCQYTTIGDALAASQDGDRIMVGPGTYSGGFTISTNVTVQGTGEDATILIPGGPRNQLGLFGPVVAVASDTTATMRGVTITGNRIMSGALSNSGTLRLINSAVSRTSVAGYGNLRNTGTLTLINSSVHSEWCTR